VGGGHEKKVLCLGVILFAVGLQEGPGWYQTATAAAEEELLNIHQKASACFDSNMTSTFPVNPEDPDDPTLCDNDFPPGVCQTCHPSLFGGGAGVLPGTDNPDGAWTASTYQESGSGSASEGLYQEVSWEEQWTSLPEEHQSCNSSKCHADYAQKAGNHPIFVSMTWASEQLPMFEDMVLCATCHKPHAGETLSLLRVANAGSMLCLTCHTNI